MEIDILPEQASTQSTSSPDHSGERPAWTSETQLAVAAPEERVRLRDRLHLADWLELTKPEITFLVSLSAFAGFLLSQPPSLDFTLLTALLSGVSLCSGGASVLNHVVERRHDARMRRTSTRPLPSGRIRPLSAGVFGVGLCLLGLASLVLFVNLLTTGLAFLTILLYVAIYTPLKRQTHYNTLVGTLPGALPALGGWTAATHALEPAGWTIFFILVTWQMPHFLSLAWMYRKDYDRAGYRMLTGRDPLGTSTARQMVGFAAALLVASLSPLAFGLMGPLYFAGALVAGVWMITITLRFYRDRTAQTAREVLKASILHIPFLLLLMLLERFV